jgi:hypothetical protein
VYSKHAEAWPERIEGGEQWLSSSPPQDRKLVFVPPRDAC